MHQILEILLGLGLAGIVMNGLLVVTVLRIKNRQDEINLALVLSAADIVVAMTTVVRSFPRMQTASPRINLCQLLGFVDFTLLFVAMGLVALISLVRWSRVVGKPIPFVFWVFIGAVSLIYFPTVVLSTMRSEFEVSPSGLDCSAQTSASLLSAAVVSLLGFSMLVLLFITLGGYFSILSHLSDTCDRYKDTSKFMMDPKLLRNKNPAVLARNLGIAIVYVFLVIPPAAMLLLAATHKLNFTNHINLIFVSIISIANPCLVLFAHSTIFHQLTSCFRKNIDP